MGAELEMGVETGMGRVVFGADDVVVGLEWPGFESRIGMGFDFRSKACWVEMRLGSVLSRT